MGYVLASRRHLQPHGPAVALMVLGAIYYGALATSVHLNGIAGVDGAGSTHELSNMTTPPVKLYVHSDYFLTPLPATRTYGTSQFFILLRNKRFGLCFVKKGCLSRHTRFLLLLLLLLGGDVETNPGPPGQGAAPAVPEAAASQPLPPTDRRSIRGPRLSLPSSKKKADEMCAAAAKTRCKHSKPTIGTCDYTLTCCMCEKTFHCDCGFDIPSDAKNFGPISKFTHKLKICCSFCHASRTHPELAAVASGSESSAACVDAGTQTVFVDAAGSAAAQAQPSTSAAGPIYLPTTTDSDTQTETDKSPPRKITAFHGYRMSLSNFFPLPMKFADEEGKSLEHLFQATKARRHGQKDLAREILAVDRASEAKSLAKQVPCSEEWKNRRAALMGNLLQAKFETPAAVDFRRDLYRSGKNGIIAHSTPHPGSDKYWSTDMSMEETVRCASGVFRGRNLLGVQLMALRDEKWQDLVREFGTAEPEDVPPSQLLPAAPSTSNDSCRYCGVPGHSTLQCRYDRALVCHSCHRTGHKKRYCNPDAPAQANTTNDTDDRRNIPQGPPPRLIDIHTSPPWPPRGFCPPVHHPYLMPPPGFFRNLGFGPYMPLHPHPNVHAMRYNAFGARANVYGARGNRTCVNGNMATRPGRRGDQAPAAVGRVATA
jgi:ribA/ribD-fused uncharacterized protein